MFKILNGYENIDSNIFFEIKESKITRGHNFTLVIEADVDCAHVRQRDRHACLPWRLPSLDSNI